MAINVVNHVLESSKATRNKRLVLLVLAEVASHDGTDAWTSVRTIATRANCSERSAQYALRDLEQDGEIRSCGPHPKHQTTVYMVVGPFNPGASDEGNASSPGGATLAPPETDEGVQVATPGGASSDAGGAISEREGVQPTAPEPSLNRPGEPSPKPPDARAREAVRAEVMKILGEIAEIRGLPFPEPRRVDKAIEAYPDADPVAAAREQHDYLCDGAGRTDRVRDVIGPWRGKLQRDDERAKRAQRGTGRSAGTGRGGVGNRVRELLAKAGEDQRAA